MATIVEFIPDDDDLLRRFLANDPGAIKIVQRWIRGVIHCRFHFHSDDADDLTMESLLQVVQTCSKPGFTIQTSFKALVRVIAARRCMVKINPAYAEIPMSREILEAKSRPQETDHSQLVLSQYADIIRQVLARLSETCQEVLDRRFFRKQKLRDIAAAMGYSPGGARANLHHCLRRALPAINELMKQHGLSRQDLLEEFPS